MIKVLSAILFLANVFCAAGSFVKGDYGWAMISFVGAWASASIFLDDRQEFPE